MEDEEELFESDELPIQIRHLAIGTSEEAEVAQSSTENGGAVSTPLAPQNSASVLPDKSGLSQDTGRPITHTNDNIQIPPIDNTKSQNHSLLDAFLEGDVNDRKNARDLTDPRIWFPNGGQVCKDHHSNYEVFKLQGLIAFQQWALAEVAGKPPVFRKVRKANLIGGEVLNDEEEKALRDALDSGEQAALLKEVSFKLSGSYGQKYF